MVMPRSLESPTLGMAVPGGHAFSADFSLLPFMEPRCVRSGWTRDSVPLESVADAPSVELTLGRCQAAANRNTAFRPGSCESRDRTCEGQRGRADR